MVGGGGVPAFGRLTNAALGSDRPVSCLPLCMELQSHSFTGEDTLSATLCSQVILCTLTNNTALLLARDPRHGPVQVLALLRAQSMWSFVPGFSWLYGCVCPNVLQQSSI